MAEALLGAGKFQSTLSVRRATLRPTPSPAGSDISIHALRKESDAAFGEAVEGAVISIHALRKESDRTPRDCTGRFRFQSTLSVRRATSQHLDFVIKTHISIHALRKESDLAMVDRLLECVFQSTLSVRRATHRLVRITKRLIISIHALRKESDKCSKSHGRR